MADKHRFFDLHMEVGQATTGKFYARLVLGKSIEYREEGSTPAAAASKLVLELERQNMWNIMAKNPTMCTYPIPGARAPLALGTTDPAAPKKRPSELSGVTKPGCQARCASYEHFLDTKCASMCPQKS